jgi:hypothetical protein
MAREALDDRVLRHRVLVGPMIREVQPFAAHCVTTEQSMETA